MELKPATPTAKAPAERFTGDVYLNIIKTPEDTSRLVAPPMTLSWSTPRR